MLSSSNSLIEVGFFNHLQRHSLWSDSLDSQKFQVARSHAQSPFYNVEGRECVAASELERLRIRLYSTACQ